MKQATGWTPVHLNEDVVVVVGGGTVEVKANSLAMTIFLLNCEGFCDKFFADQGTLSTSRLFHFERYHSPSHIASKSGEVSTSKICVIREAETLSLTFRPRNREYVVGV
jgi:hypothetical protein